MRKVKAVVISFSENKMVLKYGEEIYSIKYENDVLYLNGLENRDQTAKLLYEVLCWDENEQIVKFLRQINIYDLCKNFEIKEK